MADDLFRGIFDALLEHIALIDQEGTILLTNRAWDRFARENGDPSLRKTGVGVNYLEVCRQAMAQDASLGPVLEGISDVLAGRREQFIFEYDCHSPGEQRWFLMHATSLHQVPDRVVLNHINITERKKAENGRLEVIGQLEQALAEVRTLRGMLPICAVCKKVRDDEGYWSQIEKYLFRQTGVVFSHGLCPDCLKKYERDRHQPAQT